MKKKYYIPTIEIVFVRTAEMMWDLEGSNSMQDHAPKRRNPYGMPEGGSKVF